MRSRAPSPLSFRLTPSASTEHSPSSSITARRDGCRASRSSLWRPRGSRSMTPGSRRTAPSVSCSAPSSVACAPRSDSRIASSAVGPADSRCTCYGRRCGARVGSSRGRRGRAGSGGGRRPRRSGRTVRRAGRGERAHRARGARGRARAGARILGEILGTASASLPASPYGVGRRASSLVIRRALAEADVRLAALRAIYAGENGDARRDAWESRVLENAAPGTPTGPPLARQFGQTSALGPLKVVAAAREAPALVHGLARGGSEVTLVVGAAPVE